MWSIIWIHDFTSEGNVAEGNPLLQIGYNILPQVRLLGISVLSRTILASLQIGKELAVRVAEARPFTNGLSFLRAVITCRVAHIWNSVSDGDLLPLRLLVDRASRYVKSWIRSNHVRASWLCWDRELRLPVPGCHSSAISNVKDLLSEDLVAQSKVVWIEIENSFDWWDECTRHARPVDWLIFWSRNTLARLAPIAWIWQRSKDIASEWLTRRADQTWWTSPGVVEWLRT